MCGWAETILDGCVGIRKTNFDSVDQSLDIPPNCELWNAVAMPDRANFETAIIKANFEVNSRL
jgi:hypothetical protein